MPDPQIQPHRVTKPIQLVAAWLAGLVLIDGMFLTAAASLDRQSWTHGLLIIAAVANVPAFLVAIFLLQTKFRAELQEDSFYSEYLSKRTSQVIKIDKNSEQDLKLESLERKLHKLELAAVQPSFAPAPVNSKETKWGDWLVAVSKETKWGDWLVAVNGQHPQLKEIVGALEEAGIPVETTFGEKEGNEAPKRWVISINYKIPSHLQVLLLRTLAPFDFMGFHRWKPRQEAEEFEDVYVGSYGDESVVPFTKKFKEQLAGPDAAKSLNTYYLAHDS